MGHRCLRLLSDACMLFQAHNDMCASAVGRRMYMRMSTLKQSEVSSMYQQITLIGNIGKDPEMRVRRTA